MDEVFSCIDQWGRRIHLAERIWLTKIAIPGRIPLSCLAEVEKTITEPDYVVYDKVHRNRECFYKAGMLPFPQHQTLLKVVIELSVPDEEASTSGTVVTAFPVARIHHREIPKWSSIETSHSTIHRASSDLAV